jgi:hypothetical protein
MANEQHNAEELRKAGFADGRNSLENLGISTDDPGQSNPRHYTHQPDPLGEPLTIRQTARLLGCSPWTVRHSYVPRGLPYLRSGPLGKLTFYRDQVIKWILEHQRKGRR